MNKERLLAMASYMEQLPPDKYDQDSWLTGLEASAISVDMRGRVTLKEGFCGTAACVLGHAPAVPELKDQGLYIRLVESMYSGAAGIRNEETGRIFRPTSARICAIDKDGSEQEGFNAGSTFFDITQDDAEIIFGATTFATLDFYSGDPLTPDDQLEPWMVATALREYVATDGASIQRIHNRINDGTYDRLEVIYGDGSNDED